MFLNPFYFQFSYMRLLDRLQISGMELMRWAGWQAGTANKKLEICLIDVHLILAFAASPFQCKPFDSKLSIFPAWYVINTSAPLHPANTHWGPVPAP